MSLGATNRTHHSASGSDQCAGRDADLQGMDLRVRVVGREKLKFHGSSLPRSILVTSALARHEEIGGVSDVSDEDATRLLARMTCLSGMSARMSRRCYDETAPVEFQRK